jgi:MFS family permease
VLAAPRSRLRPFRAGLWFGGFNGVTWMIGLGTPMVLLAQQLGANAFQIGLASSFVFLLLPVQVVATGSLARLGYKRQMVLGWGIRALFLLVPLALALRAPAPPAPWMADLFVASVFGFCLFRAFGIAAHLPWFAVILPADVRGRFFATDSALTSVVGVATLLSCAALFAKLPGWQAFAVLYAAAVVGSALAVASLLRLPSAPAPAPIPLHTLHREARRLWREPGLFRHYLALSLLGAVLTSSIGAFSAYFLRVEAGLAESHVLVLTAAQFAGQIAAGGSIRHAIDRVPLRRLFQLGALGVAGVELFWLVYVSGSAALVDWLPAASFLFGASVGVSNAAHFTVLPELAGEARRPVALAVFTATHGLLAGLAPMLFGLWLKKGGADPGLDLQRFAVFFAAGAAGNLLLAALFGRLRETRSLR